MKESLSWHYGCFHLVLEWQRKLLSVLTWQTHRPVFISVNMKFMTLKRCQNPAQWLWRNEACLYQRCMLCWAWRRVWDSPQLLSDCDNWPVSLHYGNGRETLRECFHSSNIMGTLRFNILSTLDERPTKMFQVKTFREWCINNVLRMLWKTR